MSKAENRTQWGVGRVAGASITYSAFHKAVVKRRSAPIVRRVAVAAAVMAMPAEMGREWPHPDQQHDHG